MKFKLYNDIIDYDYQDILEMMKEPMWLSADDDLITLDAIKVDKIMILKAQCELEIINGFESDCLGELKHFDCQSHDQANITGQTMVAFMAMTTGDTSIPIGFKLPGTFECTPFAPEQMIKLARDMQDHITLHVSKVGSLCKSVYLAESKSEVDAIVW